MRRSCLAVGAIVLVVALVLGGVVVRLAEGPITIDGLGPRIARALDARFGRGFAFNLGATSITKHGYAPTLNIDGLALKGSNGETILTAPRAEVSVDPFALVVGQVTPKRLELFDIELRLSVRPNGTLSISAGPNPQQGVALFRPLEAMGRTTATPAAMPGKVSRAVLIKQAAAAIRLLIDTLTNPDSPIAAIDRVGIARGRLVIDDQATDQSTVLDGVALSFDKSTGRTSFNLAADGPDNRHWSVSGSASGTPGRERRLHIEMKGLSLDEISLASGIRNLGADFDMPLSTSFDIALTPQGTLAEAAGRFDFGSGYLRFDDPDDEPLMLKSISGGFHWDGQNRRVVIDKTTLTAHAPDVAGAVNVAPTELAFAGKVTPPVNEGDPWRIALENDGPCVIGPARPGEAAISIDHGELTARLDLTAKRLDIDRFAFNGPEGGLALAGDFDWAKGPHLRLGAQIDPTPARAVVRLWPSFAAANVRAWFLAHVRDGVVQTGKMQLDFDAAAIAAMRADIPPPADAISIDFSVTRGSLGFLPGVPPLSNMSGSGHVGGRTSTFTLADAQVDVGSGRKLVLSDGTFTLPNAAIKPTPISVAAHVSGGVEAVGDLLGREALKPYASLPLDPKTLKGQVDGRLGINMLIGAGSGPEDTHLKINANVTNFVAEKLVGKEKLDAATLAINVDQTGLHASGQGRMFGAPATLELAKPPDLPGQASISVVLDDAARAKQGFGAIPGLTGPIGAHVTMPIGGSDKPKVQVELDLSRASLEGALFGINKPAGRSGKVSFVATLGDQGTKLDQINLEAGSVQARGSAELGPDQSFVSAKFSQVKVSPGDDMRIDVAKAGDGMRMTVRGATIDARPFLTPFSLASEHAKPALAAHGKEPQAFADIDVDLKSSLLTGFNKRVMTGADLHLVKHGDQVRQFSLSGHFGRDAIIGKLTGEGSGAPQLQITTADAGSLLSFLDLYKHMERGHLSVMLRLGTGGLAGALDIKDFVLRDEPALRRLVAEGVQHATAADTGKVAQTFDAGAVSFNKLQVYFQRVGTRLDLHDGTMYGPNIGLTVDGWIDFGRDKVNMNGTFVPAYAFNNLFSQIPIFGLLLGGGSHEGLFAVNYQIAGLASKPTLNVNPLSAIAPGILRKILGVGIGQAPPAQ